jgi:predicted ATPase
MIRRIQALNYRCLHHVDVALDRFHVLVGPNAAGKSTLFDVVAFLSDFVSDGLGAAVEKRTRNFQDLVWSRPKTGLGFQLAVEFVIPAHVKERLPKTGGFQLFRYEIEIEETKRGAKIVSERGLLMHKSAGRRKRRALRFPEHRAAPDSILQGSKGRKSRTVLRQRDKDGCSYRTETTLKSGWTRRTYGFLGRTRAALSDVRVAESGFPMASYVASMLEAFTTSLILDSLCMRQPSPLKKNLGFSMDGSSLPWVVKFLREHRKSDYHEWILHIKTVLPDIEDIRVVEREDDRHAYLMLRYREGVEVPSWMTSDGTLRLLALAVLAYLPTRRTSSERGFFSDRLFLVEEPENGVHPMALDAIYDSLASVYSGQVLVATHSPVFLRMAKPEDVLCFAKTEGGATDIVRGDAHPLLRDWQGSVDMDLLFAMGVIG